MKYRRRRQPFVSPLSNEREKHTLLGCIISYIHGTDRFVTSVGLPESTPGARLNVRFFRFGVVFVIQMRLRGVRISVLHRSSLHHLISPLLLLMIPTKLMITACSQNLNTVVGPVFLSNGVEACGCSAALAYCSSGMGRWRC